MRGVAAMPVSSLGFKRANLPCKREGLAYEAPCLQHALNWPSESLGSTTIIQGCRTYGQIQSTELFHPDCQ